VHIATLIGMATLALAQNDRANARLLADEALSRSRKLGVGLYERKAERLLRVLSGQRPSSADAVAG
jgi:hypothetical protein